MFGYHSGVGWFDAVANICIILCIVFIVGLFVIWPAVDKIRAIRQHAAEVARLTGGEQ